MPNPTRRAGKLLILTDLPGQCQGSQSPRSYPNGIASLALTLLEQPSKADDFESFTQTLAALPIRPLPKQHYTDNQNYTAAPVTKCSLGKGDGFPTQRRPTQRTLSTDSRETIEAWFRESGITIGIMADTPERIQAAKQLAYTWKDCFATSVRDIKTTDLIKHSIDLVPNAKPVTG